jgi:adenylate cyclase
VPAGLQRTVTLPLEEGRYRLRTPGLPGGQLALVTADGLPAAAFRASAMGWSHEELRLAPVATLRLDNATEREQLFCLERLAWTDQAATAADVIALQCFRDLFAHEVLRPGEQISVGSLTVLFTDLCDSTRLYRMLGDAPAFGRVIDHFEILRQAVAGEEGTVVKTIGDAVMAVFRHPAAALRMVARAQQALAARGEGHRPLRLKAGIHYGPCIAVTLNDRLDYFGTTVNLAARLNRFSSGGDIIVSAAVCADPEVAELFAHPDGGLVAEPFEAELKGFDEERFELWRATPVGSSANHSALGQRSAVA